VVLPHYPAILCGESRLLISWCAGDRCDMVGSYEDHGRSRRRDAEDREWSSTGRVLGGQMIERSGDAMCGLYRTQGDEECEFLSLALKPRSMICQWFGLKTSGTSFPFWTSKPAATVW
jgi:hypothetical protein